MRRLSIIDLAGGHQPIFNEDETLAIVFNGEIYNHREVRGRLEAKGHRFRTATDTECIVHAYEEYGPACLTHLNGMFAFAIWDERRHELFIARDRVGIKPLYYHLGRDTLSFASEIKSLMAGPPAPRELNHEALVYFLQYGYVSAPATLFAQVRQLPPAHYMIATSAGVTEHRYWSVAFTPSSRSEDECAAQVGDALTRAVQSQLISDVPLGAFLSGGLDSSSVVQIMSDVTGAAVSTYAIGFAGPDAFHSELDDAKFMSTHCRTAHHEIVVEPQAASLLPRLVHHLDQPLADSSFVVTYLVSALARETVKVILSGVGGDELFGGYRRYLGPGLDRYYDHVPAPFRGMLAAVAARVPVDRGSAMRNYARLARSFVTSHGAPEYERYDSAVRLLPDAVLHALAPALSVERTALGEQRRQYFEAVPGPDALARMQNLDLHTSLPDSLLMLTDKMSMATSLEARVPFLDHELVELAAGIPSAFKVKGTRLRHIQKKSMQGRLPRRILRKKKRGFGFPIGAWFRRGLKPLLLDTLAHGTLRRRGLFDPAVVDAVVEAHLAQRQDYSDLLLALLTFELWHREWIAQ